MSRFRISACISVLVLLCTHVGTGHADPVISFSPEGAGQAFNAMAERLQGNGELDLDVRVEARGCSPSNASEPRACRYQDVDGQSIIAEGEPGAPTRRIVFATADDERARRAFLTVAVRLLVPSFAGDARATAGYLDSVEALIERFRRAVSLLDGKEFLYFYPRGDRDVGPVAWEANPLTLSVQVFRPRATGSR